MILDDLLRELGERVEIYVLAWAGAPLPLFRPGRRDVDAELARLGRHPECGSPRTAASGRCTAITRSS